MALLVEKGTFTKTTTTTGLPFTQQINLVDSGLTPKALILWSNGLTTTDGTYAENYEFTYGFSDGTNDVCQQITVEDNDTACVASYSFNNNCILTQCNTATPAAGTQVSRADVSAFAAGSFTLNWTVQSDTTAKVFHYIVLGGSDIENVSVFQTTVGDTSTGNHSFNGSGTTFTPNFALTQTASDAYVTMNSLSTTAAGDAGFGIGAAASTTKEYCLSGVSEDAATTSDCNMDFHDNACLMALIATTGAENFLADFVSFNSAAGGGITVNVSNAAGLSTQAIGFMLIKTSSTTLVDVGTFSQRSGTGTQDVALTESLDPQVVFLSGINNATANSTQIDNFICLGASDGTREGCAWCGDDDASGLMVNTRRNLTTKVYTQATPNATAGSSTTNAEADMTDMNSIPKFTLDWTTASATLHKIGFWAIGNNGRITKDTILKWNINQRMPSPSLIFDGSGDSLGCGNHSDLWSQAQTKFSVAFWFYPEVNTGGNRDLWKHIVSDDMYCLQNNTDVVFRVNTGSEGEAFGAFGAINTWHHIVCVFDSTLGSNQMKVYLNGNSTPLAQTTKTGTIAGSSQNMRLGDTFDGNMKDFRWYTGTALNTTEIADIYNNASAAPRPNYWLQMNEGTSTPVDTILGKTTSFTGDTTWSNKSPIVWSGKFLTLKWNIVGRILKNLILKWNILARISKTLTLKWDIEEGLERILKDLTLKWNIIGRISKTLTLKWNIIQFITKALTLKWNIIGRIDKLLTLKWNIIGRISKALTLKWNIIGRISKDTILKWNIQQRILKDIILKWNIQNFITKTLTLKWNIQQRILKDTILKWNIIGRISKTLTLKWNIIGRITKNIILKWNIIGRISKTLTLKWDIISGELERITKDVILKWNIIGRISKPLTLKWNIQQRVLKDLILKWNIQQRVLKTLTLKWNILTRISKTLILKWNILNFVSKSLILKWNIVGRITKNLTLKWNILSSIREILFPSAAGTLQPQDTETSSDKRATPNWWRNSWYGEPKRRRGFSRKGET